MPAAFSPGDFLAPLFALHNLNLVELFLLVSIGVTRGRPRIAFGIVAFIAAVLAGLVLTSNGVQTAVWITPERNPALQRSALIPRAIVPGTVVVRVYNAALNPSDLKFFARATHLPFFRWILPHTLAHDVSGVVAESACPLRLKVGDEVFGVALGGSLTEYALATCEAMHLKPTSVSFAKAAALPVAVASAFEALNDVVKKGHNVVVIGSAGGCGHMGVLLAKSMGAARVICIASERSRKTSVALGCDEFFAYTAPDFNLSLLDQWRGKIDVVYDSVSSGEDNDYYELSLQLLKEPTGRIMALNGYSTDWLAKFTGMSALQRPRRTLVLAQTSGATWEEILRTHLKALESVSVVILGSAFNLDHVQAALTALKSNHVTGKLVLTVLDAKDR